MRGGKAPRQVVWASARPPWVEYCIVRKKESGWALGGTILRRVDGRADVITYLIETDPGWKTRKVSVDQLIEGKRTSLEIEAKRSRWFVQGREKKRLERAIDGPRSQPGDQHSSNQADQD